MGRLDEIEKLLDEAQALVVRGALEEAQARLERAPPDLQGEPRFQYALGYIALERGAVDLARRCFERAVAEAPEVPEYRANLAAALVAAARRDGDPKLLDQAIAHLEDAARRGPKLPLTHSNLGQALAEAGRPAEALEAFARALAIDPTDPAARYNRAAVLRALGRESEALSEIERVIAEHPDFAPALRAHCTLLLRLGRRTEAREAHRVYRARVPDAPALAELEAEVDGAS